jgi:hypothetical protein
MPPPPSLLMGATMTEVSSEKVLGTTVVLLAGVLRTEMQRRGSLPNNATGMLGIPTVSDEKPEKKKPTNIFKALGGKSKAKVSSATDAPRDTSSVHSTGDSNHIPTPVSEPPMLKKKSSQVEQSGDEQEIFNATNTSSRRSSVNSIKLGALPNSNESERFDSLDDEKSGPTEYQRLNSLQYLFSKYEKEMDMMRERFKGKEEEDTILYRFLKAFNHDVEAATKRLEASLVWRKENNFADIIEKYKNCPYDELPNFKMISRFYPHK